MKTITTSYTDIRVGRVCHIKRDYKASIIGLDGGTTATLPKGLKVVILPQIYVRNNISLDNLGHDRNSLLTNIPLCDENKTLGFKYLSNCCLVSISYLKPTNELFINLLDLDWKATETIMQSCGVNTNLVDQTLGKKGTKELIVLYRKFAAAQRNYMLVQCPKCKKDANLTFTHDLRCQECGHYFETTLSNFKKMLPKSFTEVITGVR